MEIKAVFFDIDGTLVNDSRAVLKSTEKAIQSLKEEGIYVGLATGRDRPLSNRLWNAMALILP